MKTIRIWLGHEALDVTLAYLKGKVAESGEAQEHANSGLALYEIAHQQQPEIHAWRRARPSHDFHIEWLPLTFDEIIEVVLGQPLIQSRVE